VRESEGSDYWPDSFGGDGFNLRLNWMITLATASIQSSPDLAAGLSGAWSSSSACIRQGSHRGSYCFPDFVRAAQRVALAARDFGMVLPWESTDLDRLGVIKIMRVYSVRISLVLLVVFPSL
jgi:hypothetical protein